MNRISFGWLGAAACAAVVATLAVVAGCGSGAVSAPAPTSSGPITITPSTATLYSDLPSTFFVSGGNGNYIVASSDQNALRVSGSFTGSELTVIPSQVGADTPVTLTVRDTASTTPATAELTVKPRTVNNVLTITPSSTQAPACGTALCAGGDAQVRAVLTQNGVPLQQRAVRFEVLSGDLRVITSAAGLPETLALATTTATDNTGTAVVRVRALPEATAQTALIQVTDLGSGFIQRASVTIAGTTGSPLAASPSSITFQGTDFGTCADNISADVIVSGGRAPYQVSQPSNFIVSPLTVTANGGRFTVTARGQCTPATGTTIAVVDAAGAAVTVTVINRVPDTTNLPAFNVSPATVTLSSCNDSATVLLVGGTGNYVATTRVGAIRVTNPTRTSTGAVSTISRQPGTTPGSSTATVSFSDGRTVKDVVVTLTGSALSGCDSTGADTVRANPASVTLSSCSDSPNVVISGGTGNYTHSSSSSAVSATLTNNILTIRRTPGTAPPSTTNPCQGTFTAGATQCVTVSDGVTSAQVDVVINGGAAAPCP